MMRRADTLTYGRMTFAAILIIAAGMFFELGDASAQTAPPSQAITPPGSGMIAQPCPLISLAGPTELPEPGKVPDLDPKVVQAYVAIREYQQKYDWAWLCRYRAENQQAGSASGIRIVFIGDSITENWQRYDPSYFSAQVLNRGISGQTTPQILVRFYQDVIALRPKVVHIMAGTNDVAGNTGPNTPDDFKNNLRAMVELAQAHHIAVVIGSIPPASRFPWAQSINPAPQIAELNAWLKLYAGERHATYADYYAALADGEGQPQPDTTSDGVHPGSKGYAVMRKIADRAIAAATQ